ncbi:hypothetical protein MJ561_03920 [Klebsiella pneumoniae]|nr:hypothetical protein MJ561_03920 [Klebsiella pneumoniae]
MPSITAMSELTRHTDFVVRNLFDMGRITPAPWPTGGGAYPRLAGY